MQILNKTSIPSYNSGYCNNNKSVLPVADNEFQKQVKLKGEENIKSSGAITKEEILKSFPGLTEEDLENIVAVYPKALYDAFQNGDNISPMGGIITVAPDYLYTANPSTGEFTFRGYPEFGMKNLQYAIHTTQEAMKAYDLYYTEQERNRALQVAESKKAFYKLADMISSYQKSS